MAMAQSHSKPNGSSAILSGPISVFPVVGVREVQASDRLTDHLLDSPALSQLRDAKSDETGQPVLVVAQKIVSKAEGRQARLSDFTPTEKARDLAVQTGKDPRIVEAILSESDEVIRSKPGVIIVRDHRGLILANAGIDRSNIGGDGEDILLLPKDPDASARKIRDEISRHIGFLPAVIISDSLGRPWRLGTVNIAIGAAGLPAVIDQSGQKDRHGRVLESTVIGFADSIAAAAGLAMGEAAEGIPAAIVTGLRWDMDDQPASAILRPPEEDLFL